MVVISLAVAAAPAPAAVPSWTTYRRDGARSGVDPDSSSTVAPTQAWQTSSPLDGDIYGQPLVYGSRVFVATENDTVYALDAATGAVLWQRHLATAVPAGQLPCGDIKPTIGITSTPVIDPSTGTIYVVGDTWDGTHPDSIHHQLFGLSIDDGAPAPGLPIVVDPPGTTPAAQLQRPGLALDDGKVIVGYGGNAGDCGTYNGWLVAASEQGGSLGTFEVERPSTGGAIWGSGNAPPIDSSGDVWVSTGNGFGSFDHQESVLKLDPNLTLLDYWAPADWQALDGDDTDLGSSEPILLPDGLVFEIGKEGVGILLSTSHLGGTGAAPVFDASVCAGSWGGGVYYNGVIYVTCDDGMRALSLDLSARRFAPLPTWVVNPDAVGPPIVAGGLVWSADFHTGTLYGLDPQTGGATFTAELGSFDHFASPSAAGGRLFVANGDLVTALEIATLPPPDRSDHARHRRLQGRQRHLRPSPGRRRAPSCSPRLARKFPRRRLPGALRWRGVVADPAAHRSRGCPRDRRAYPYRPSTASAWPGPTGAACCAITASLGVAASTDGDKDAPIADADAALYEAKRTGKNRTVSARARAADASGAG